MSGFASRDSYPKLRLSNDVLDKGYTVDWFGRKGLKTRDPLYLVCLEGDEHQHLFGMDRIYPAEMLVGWVVMDRCGIHHDEVDKVCRDRNPAVLVIPRFDVTAVIPPNRNTMYLHRGSEMRISFLHGLESVYHPNGGALYERSPK